MEIEYKHGDKFDDTCSDRMTCSTGTVINGRWYTCTRKPGHEGSHGAHGVRERDGLVVLMAEWDGE